MLSAFMQALFEKAVAAASSELKFPQNIAVELQNLSSSLSTILAHVEDAEERQLKDQAARSWLSRLKDVAYEMDDLLDEHAAEVLRSKLAGPSNYHHLKVRICFCSSETELQSSSTHIEAMLCILLGLSQRLCV